MSKAAAGANAERSAWQHPHFFLYQYCKRLQNEPCNVGKCCRGCESRECRRRAATQTVPGTRGTGIRQGAMCSCYPQWDLVTLEFIYIYISIIMELFCSFGKIGEQIFAHRVSPRVLVKNVCREGVGYRRRPTTCRLVALPGYGGCGRDVV